MNPRTTRCCAGLMCLFVALSDVAHAAQAEPPQAREYSIEPGPLGDTLAQFAAMSNVQLLFEPTIVAGLRSGGLQGAYTVEAGFARILEASGYEIVKREEGVYALAARSGNAGVKTMRKVRVEAEKASETATDPVVGYVARRTATATKTDTPLIEIPQAVNIVTRDEIAARGGARSINDALAYTPGFFNPEPVNTRIDNRGSLRGFRVSGSVYVDGMRLPAMSQVEPAGIESIEILKGPASVNGQNAPGGLINLVSKRPTSDPLGDIYLAAGTFSRLEGAVDVSSAINDSLLYRLNGMVRRSDTQIDYVEDDRTYVAPSLMWIIGPKTRLTVLGHAQQDSGGEFCNKLPWPGTAGPSADGRIPRNRFMGDPKANKYDRRQRAAGYSFEHQFNGAVQIAQDFRYFELDVDYDNLSTEAGRLYSPYQLNRLRAFFNDSFENYNLDTRLQIDAAMGTWLHKIVTGVELGRRDATAKNGYYPGGATPINVYQPVYGQLPDVPPQLVTSGADETEQKAVYLQDQLKLGRWVVTLGGRHDWADNTGRGVTYGYQSVTSSTYRYDDGAFTAHAGVVYSKGSIAPYLSWSESFEWQSVDGLGRVLKPMTGEQVEIGLRWRPDQRSLVTLALFELKQQNIVTSDFYHGTIQIGESRVRGVELEAKANFDRWDLSFAYAYADSDVTRSLDIAVGTPLADNPQQQATLWAVYKPPFLAGFDVGGGARYTGRNYGAVHDVYDLGAPPENPSVTLFDLALGYDMGQRFGAESLRLSLNARNVADKEYVYCDGQRIGCSWGASRTLQAAVRYTW